VSARHGGAEYERKRGSPYEIVIPLCSHYGFGVLRRVGGRSNRAGIYRGFLAVHGIRRRWSGELRQSVGSGAFRLHHFDDRKYRRDRSASHQLRRYDSSGKAGTLYVEAEGAGLPAYFLTGTETDPTAPGSDFKANWWYANSRQVVKQASDFPDIAFGASSITLYTDKNSALGVLIGGNSDSNFSFLPVRGVYPSAHMIVTVTAK
jgi:hypothetical protein